MSILNTETHTGSGDNVMFIRALRLVVNHSIVGICWPKASIPTPIRSRNCVANDQCILLYSLRFQQENI